MKPDGAGGERARAAELWWQQVDAAAFDGAAGAFQLKQRSSVRGSRREEEEEEGGDGVKEKRDGPPCPFIRESGIVKRQARRSRRRLNYRNKKGRLDFRNGWLMQRSFVTS